MNRLTHPGALDSLLSSTPVLLLQFGSETCAPCSAISEKLRLWAQERPEAACVYVSIEEFPALAAEYGIFTVPAVLVFAQGRLTIRESGYFSLAQVLHRAERYLELLASP